MSDSGPPQKPTTDDFEYEIEPPDPEVLANEKQLKSERAAELIARAEPDRNPPPESFDWTEDFKLRFSTRDGLIWVAMIATALLALRLGGLCFAFTVLLVEAFIWTLLTSEKAHRERLREKGVAMPEAWDGPGPGEASPERRGVRFAFSTADLLIAVTIVAVGFGLSNLLSSSMAAAVFGVLVLTGIVFYWLGVEPGRKGTLAWLMLTATWLLISAKAMMGL